MANSKANFETQADFEIENHGTIFLVRPVTEAAKVWVAENVSLEPYQWIGAAFAVEHRYIYDLREGIVADGFRVR